MWNETPLTERLGIRYPIVQGPFGGGLSSPKLAAAVSNAGGLGSYGAEGLSGDDITEVVIEIKALTTRPFAINLWIPKDEVPPPSEAEFEEYMARLDSFRKKMQIERPPRPQAFSQRHEDQVKAILRARPPVFSFVYGVPDSQILKECRRTQILTIGTATTPFEAAMLDDAGVDCIVASGFEAGGHKGAFLHPPEECLIGTFSLIPQVADIVRAPVIAAGGIADARGINAALALGAHGVQIGTAFLACDESSASEAFRQLLLAGPSRAETVLTKTFTGRLARTMRNRLYDHLKRFEDCTPPYPIQSWILGTLKSAAIERGQSDFISLWTGQSAPLVRIRQAKELFEHLVHAMDATGV